MKRIALLLTLGASAFAITDSPAMTFRTFLTGSPIMAVDPDGVMYVANLAPSADVPCTVQLNLPSTGLGPFGISRIRVEGGPALWTACLPVEATAVAAGGDGSVSVFIGGATPGLLRLRASDGTVIHFTPVPYAFSRPRLAADREGGVYAAFRAGPGFAVTPGSINQTQGVCTPGGPAGCRAAVVKVGASGSIEYATFLGVENSLDLVAIEVDSTHAVWVAGERANSAAIDSRHSGFAVKLDAAGKEQLAYYEFRGVEFRSPANPSLIVASGPGAIYNLALDAEDSVYFLGESSRGYYKDPPSYATPVIERYRFLSKVDRFGANVYTRTLDDAVFFTHFGADSKGNVYIGINFRSFLEPPAVSPCTIWNYFGQTTASVVRVFDSQGANQISELWRPGTIDEMAVRGDGGVYTLGQLGPTSVSTPDAFLSSRVGPERPDHGVPYASKLDFSRTGTETIECVENAATLRASIYQIQPFPNVVPGEIVTIFGSNFSSPESIHIDFDGFPATILYADEQQINAAIPFQINVSGRTRMTVKAGDRTIGTYGLRSAPAAPGPFGWNDTQAVALNQDGSINTAENRALPGSTVTIFVSGAGAFAEPVKDGEPGRLTPPFAKPVRPLGVYIQPRDERVFFPAEVLSVVQAPGLINGIVQVTFRLPATLTGSQTWVFVADGGISSENTRRAILLR